MSKYSSLGYGAPLVGCAMMIVSCGGDPGSLAGPEAWGSIGQDIQLSAVELTQNGLANLVNLRTTAGNTVTGYLTAWDGSTYGSCGMTFISEHYAVTASHCVNHLPYVWDQGFSFVGVQPKINTVSIQEVLDAANVTGTWQSGWTIADQLIASDGYNTMDVYYCGVHSRCQDGHGQVACADLGAILGDLKWRNNVDIALVYCMRDFGGVYDWVPVQSNDPASGDIAIYWYHEVLKLQTSATDSANNTPAGNWANYGQLLNDSNNNPIKTNNYHYTGLGADGKSGPAELLPLLSRDWDAARGYAKYKIVGYSDRYYETETDAPICHGTSGSGAFISGSTGLLGPMVHGPKIGQRLCHDWSNVQPGGTYSTFIRPPATRVLENDPYVQADR